MLFYLQSTNPNEYEKLTFSANPQLGKGKMYFKILQASTIANFMITTDDDYIVFEIGGERKTIKFENNYKYDINELPKKIDGYLSSIGLSCHSNEYGTLTITGNEEFKIVEITHRAKLLLGLYHSTIPIESQDKKIIISSVPYVCYGNNLYIRSRVSSIVGFNNCSHEAYTSICYHISEMFIPGIPIITRIPGQSVRVNSYDLTNLEFTLVDFQNEPIKLKAPLNLVVEIVIEDEEV